MNQNKIIHIPYVNLDSQRFRDIVVHAAKQCNLNCLNDLTSEPYAFKIAFFDSRLDGFDDFFRQSFYDLFPFAAE